MLFAGCGRPDGPSSVSNETEHFRIVAPIITPKQNIIEGDHVECEFSLTSKANDVVNIEKIEAGCGCMQVVAKETSSHDSNRLEPRQTRSWTVTVNTRARAGNNEFPIEVTYRIGSATDSIKLPIQIAVHPGVFCQPPTIVINGLKANDSYQKEAVLFRDVPESLVAIESVTCTDPSITVDWTPLPTKDTQTSKRDNDEPCSHARLRIAGQVERLTRDRQEVIQIRLKGRVRPIELPLLLRPEQGEVRYSPESVMFSTSATDEQAARIVLSSRSADYLSGLKVNDAPDWLEVDTRYVGHNLVVVSLCCDGSIPPGEYAIQFRKADQVIATIPIAVK